MSTFPNIRYPIYPIQVTTPDVTYKGQVENMTILTRRRTTKALRIFTISYKVPTSEYLRLQDFFDEVNCSGIFDWTNPETKKKHRVRFMDQLDFSANDFGTWIGTVKLQEAI